MMVISLYLQPTRQSFAIKHSPNKSSNLGQYHCAPIRGGAWRGQDDVPMGEVAGSHLEFLEVNLVARLMQLPYTS